MKDMSLYFRCNLIYLIDDIYEKIRYPHYKYNIIRIYSLICLIFYSNIVYAIYYVTLAIMKHYKLFLSINFFKTVNKIHILLIQNEFNYH